MVNSKRVEIQIGIPVMFTNDSVGLGLTISRKLDIGICGEYQHTGEDDITNTYYGNISINPVAGAIVCIGALVLSVAPEAGTLVLI